MKKIPQRKPHPKSLSWLPDFSSGPSKTSTKILQIQTVATHCPSTTPPELFTGFNWKNCHLKTHSKGSLSDFISTAHHSDFSILFSAESRALPQHWSVASDISAQEQPKTLVPRKGLSSSSLWIVLLTSEDSKTTWRKSPCLHTLLTRSNLFSSANVTWVSYQMHKINMSTSYKLFSNLTTDFITVSFLAVWYFLFSKSLNLQNQHYAF